MAEQQRNLDVESTGADRSATTIDCALHAIFDGVGAVAKPNGELHDVTGAWIADASGMPSCSGVNPMVSTMALARRTAMNMLNP